VEEIRNYGQVTILRELVRDEACVWKREAVDVGEEDDCMLRGSWRVGDVGLGCELVRLWKNLREGQCY
jgi:hypothetical protein